jgi:hypothetical protein
MTDSTLSEVFNEAVSKAVSQTLQTIYPVGAYYISESATNPATLFGFGTWELLTDRTLIGAGSSYAVGVQGGSTSHTHKYGFQFGGYYSSVLIENNSAHAGALEGGVKNSLGTYEQAGTSTGWVANGATTAATQSVGSNYYACIANTSSTSNVPPYRAVYIFRRTA